MVCILKDFKVVLKLKSFPYLGAFNSFTEIFYIFSLKQMKQSWALEWLDLQFANTAFSHSINMQLKAYAVCYRKVLDSNTVEWEHFVKTIPALQLPLRSAKKC